jgi:hypothetical protein
MTAWAPVICCGAIFLGCAAGVLDAAGVPLARVVGSGGRVVGALTMSSTSWSMSGGGLMAVFSGNKKPPSADAARGLRVGS